MDVSTTAPATTQSVESSNTAQDKSNVPRGTPAQEVSNRRQESTTNKQEATGNKDISQMSQSELEDYLDLDQYANKKIKRKINGKEESFTLKEIVDGFQTRKASDEKFRESSMKEKKAEEFVRMLRTDPIKVLTHPALGFDVRKMAEEYLVSQLQDEMMDPKDKKLRDYEKRIAEIEAKEKESKEAEENDRLAQLKEHYTAEYSNSIVSALQESGLPKTEHTVKRMAYYMHQALKSGYDLKAKDVVEYVRKDYMNEQKSLFGAVDGDVLLQLLGDDVISKIRKSDVKRLKGKFPTTPTKQPPQVFRKKADTSKMTKDQWREHLLKKRT